MKISRLQIPDSLGALLALILCLGRVNSQVPSPRPHPGYDYTDINPRDWLDDRKTYGGLAWLEDGRMVVVQHGHGTNNNGKVHLFSHVLTAGSGIEIQKEEVAAGMIEPLGVEVVDGTIYVIEKDQLSKIEFQNNSWEYSMEYNLHNPIEEKHFEWWSQGLLYVNDKFYWSVGSLDGYGSVEDPTPYRHGTVVAYDPAARSHDYLVYGLRSTGGMGLGPEAAICTNDNQGDWQPSSKIICIEEGNWYGHKGEESLVREGRDESPPSIWNTHIVPPNERDHTGYGRSPGEFVMVHRGIFKGQMLVTDVNMAWLSRLFFEKVNGSWQGANFNFGGGFASGTWRLLWAPDSQTLIVGGLGGNGGGWAYPDTSNNNALTYSSLHRLKPNGTDTFEILAIRSLSDTDLEVEFTLPANAAASGAENYDVTIWHNVSGSGYGSGHKTDLKPLNVSAVELSGDGTRAVLTVDGLYEGSVVRIIVNPDNVKSQNGLDFWYWYGDYTLTHFGPADPVGVESAYYKRPGIEYRLQNNSLGPVLTLPESGFYSVKLTDVKGKIFYKEMLRQGSHTLGIKLTGGVYFLTIHDGTHFISRTITPL